jgi:hypothetical protein
MVIGHPPCARLFLVHLRRIISSSGYFADMLKGKESGKILLRKNQGKAL